LLGITYLSGVQAGSGGRADTIRTAIFAGALSASSVLGALVVYARRDEVAVFNPHLRPVAGAVIHFAVSTFWAAVFAVIAGPIRGSRLIGVAILASGVAWVVSSTLLPLALRFGNGLYGAVPRAAVVHLLMAASFVVGTRLASTK